MSELRTNRIVPRDGLVSGTGIGGGIIQVKSVTKTDTFTTTSTSLVDVPGLSVSITPTRSDSKILVMVSIAMGQATANFSYGCLIRGSTRIFVGDTRGNRANMSLMSYDASNSGICNLQSFTHMDAPATTSAVTYKMQVRCATSGTTTVNRSQRDTNGGGGADSYDTNQASSITVMEVSG
tara:strand:+ start:516 stop:1055 length:540 start_codon:yes stop_codon:yes gene_type:complete